MMNFEREHKIAFARVITDLIEADFVVEADEMKFFENVISTDLFSISDAMLVEAKKMERYRATIDEYYAFKTEFSDSKYLKEADKYYKEAAKFLNEW